MTSPGARGYRESQHQMVDGPCFECVNSQIDTDTWCSCEDYETCDGPCRNYAHHPTEHAKNYKAARPGFIGG
jgi:hypothetical protein